MREKINLLDNVQTMIVKMSEGNPGAMAILLEITKKDPFYSIFKILNLDDMNIRGTQIYLGYNDYCKGDLDLFLELVDNKDKKLIEAINIAQAKQNGRYKAVSSGASYETKRPTFTDEEMKDLQIQPMPVHPKFRQKD